MASRFPQASKGLSVEWVSHGFADANGEIWLEYKAARIALTGNASKVFFGSQLL